MTVVLPEKGDNNWDVPLNNAITELDTRVTDLETDYTLAVGPTGPAGATGPTGPAWSIPAPTSFNPNLTATGLVISSGGQTGQYIQLGKLVSFWVTIDCSYITNFGTGQWAIDFPVTPLPTTIPHFEGGAYDNSTHAVIRGDTTLGGTKIDLHYVKAAGPNSAIQEATFTSLAPLTLDSAAKVYLNGTYLAA